MLLGLLSLTGATVNMQLLGMPFLWEVALQAVSDVIATRAIDLLIALHTKLDPTLRVCGFFYVFARLCSFFSFFFLSNFFSFRLTLFVLAAPAQRCAAAP